MQKGLENKRLAEFTHTGGDNKGSKSFKVPKRPRWYIGLITLADIVCYFIKF